MDRRSVLQWISGVAGSAAAAMVGVPGVGYVLDTLKRKPPQSAALVRRVIRLNDLPQGKPVSVPVVSNRRDAWTEFPKQIVGRVWLVRQSPLDGAPADARVSAFTAICPHLGCLVQLDADKTRLVCPCHRATFGFDGQKLSQPGQKNHAPRGLDALPCRVVQDEQSQEWWVEVTYQKFEPGLAHQVAKA